MSKYPGRIITDLAPAGYSVFFDGTGDYLSTPTGQTNLTLATSDFTVEGFFYPLTQVQTNPALFTSDPGTSLANTLMVQMNAANNALALWVNNVNLTASSTNNTITLNRWNHIAVCRTGGSTYSFYINGVAVNNLATNSTSLTTNSWLISLWYLAAHYFTGYISNFRIIKGTALYSGATINVPTQLLNVTNTQLLTCNSPAIIDQSNNAFAITVNGNAAVSTLTPFAAYVPYNPALGASTPGVWTLDEALQAKGTRQWNMYDPYFNQTTLLLHGNGTNGAQNNTFLDSSSNNFSITRNGNTTQGSFSPFSLQSGQWSNYFGTRTDYISTPAVSGITTLTGDFTVETWVYVSDTTVTNWGVIDARQSGGTPNSWLIILDNYSAGVGYQINFYNAANNRGSLRVLPNTWQHIAVTRSGSTIRYFVNGVLDSTTATISGTITASATTNPVWLGSKDTGAGYGIVGYMSNFRMVNGTALYTTTFTPSTAPLTAVPNTVLLTCQSNRFIDANTQVAAKVMTPSGTVSVQPFSPFYPTAAYTPQTIGGSGYFDGSGDYLETPNNAALALGSSDFSVEWWEYRTTLAAEDTAIQAPGTYGFYFNYYDSGFPRFFLSTSSGSWNVFNNAGTGAISANTWNHFVVTRSGTAFRVFLNGVLSIYATGSGSVVQPNNNFIISGNATQSYFPGYISNVRVVRGSIPTSYQTSSTTTNTSIFTPPTAPATTTSQGATSGDVRLLLNFTNAGVVDSTGDNVLETVGNAQISTTQSRFGGSSMYFDGTGDYLQIRSSNLLAFGSSPYTVELWLYPNNVANLQGLFTMGTFRFFQNTTGLWFLSSSSTIISVATGLSTGQWFHIALVREGTGTSQTKLYLNGSSIGTGTDANTWAAAIAYVGSEGASNQLNGYIDDLRITRFARYTGNFTPQTSQWQDE